MWKLVWGHPCGLGIAGFPRRSRRLAPGTAEFFIGTARRPQGHAGLARGARRVGAPSRGRSAAGGAARQGRLPQGPAAARGLLPGLPGRALAPASGRLRLEAARRRPAEPLLRCWEGGDPGAGGRRRRHRAGPGRPLGPGERRQPGTYESRPNR